MATKPAAKPTARPALTRTQMDVFLGTAEKPLGRLIFDGVGAALEAHSLRCGW